MTHTQTNKARRQSRCPLVQFVAVDSAQSGEMLAVAVPWEESLVARSGRFEVQLSAWKQETSHLDVRSWVLWLGWLGGSIGVLVPLFSGVGREGEQIV